MFNNSCNKDGTGSALDPHRDYSYHEEKYGNSKNRRCVDGHITGSGNCVGYCTYDAHNGFLTKELREEHNCIENGCFYYLLHIPPSECGSTAEIEHAFRVHCAVLPLKLSIPSAPVEY